MVRLSHWAQGIVTFQADAASHLEGVAFIFKAHVFLGLTLFVAFPFSRLVHIWSAPLGYAIRPYQLVRRRGRNARVA
jgi:nitrate reductase gamma subunit